MNIPYVMKKCSKCGEWLIASSINFHKDKSKKYGLRSQCKKCKNKRKREYYKENKDEINKRKREYNKKNKDKILEYQREYNKKNKDKILEYQKKNKDKILEYQREYQKKNKDKILEYQREYYKENKDKILEHQREYAKECRKNNPEKTFNHNNKRRSKLENQGRGITKEQWLEMMKFFDWKCAYSGEKIKKGDKSTYGRTLDHIVALNNKGLNEPWNVIPMRLGYNSSKNSRNDSMAWYMEQEYFDIDRLNKIVEWQIYAYEKWGGEEFGELILITDLVEEVKNYE